MTDTQQSVLDQWEEQIKLYARQCPRPHELETYDRCRALIDLVRKKDIKFQEIFDVEATPNPMPEIYKICWEAIDLTEQLT